MVKRVVVAVLATCAVASTVEAARATDEPPEQWRSVWVDSFNPGIYGPDQVTQLVDDAVELNANALVVQVSRRYDCFCNRAVYPRTEAAIATRPYDPLDELLEQAHDAELEVHAWVNVGFMWNPAVGLPTSPNHVFNRHGPSATGADRWLNRKVDGTELAGTSAYVDPANPAAVDYIVRAVQSIVREYDVDGVNLDYIRYPDGSSTRTYSDWGYTDVAIARFQAATGRTDVPAPFDHQWSDWRRDQVTNLVRRIYLGIYDVDPKVRLTNNAITYGHGPQSVGGWDNTRAYAEVLQDWKGWLDEGIIDTVIAMNYKRDSLIGPANNQQRMFDEWTEVVADWQGDRQAVNGPALYLNEVEDSVVQLRDTLTPTATGNVAVGWSGYSYANQSQTAAATGATAQVKRAEQQKLVTALTTGPNAPFAEKASVPEMTWKSRPATGHVAGTVSLPHGRALDQVGVTLKRFPGGAEQTRLTDGSGWFGFVDVKPGFYLVKVDLPAGVVGRQARFLWVGKGSFSEPDFHVFQRLEQGNSAS